MSIAASYHLNPVFPSLRTGHQKARWTTKRKIIGNPRKFSPEDGMLPIIMIAGNKCLKSIASCSM